MFWLLKFFWDGPPRNFGRHYKIRHSTDHLAKFHAYGPTRLRDLALNKKYVAKPKKPENLFKAQRESARRPKYDWGKLGGEFPPHQSHVNRTQMHWHTPNAHCRLRVSQHERL